jgi:hypothetical protein
MKQYELFSKNREKTCLSTTIHSRTRNRCTSQVATQSPDKLRYLQLRCRWKENSSGLLNSRAVWQPPYYYYSAAGVLLASTLADDV